MNDKKIEMNFDILNSYSIHNLRTIARDSGVKSPTTLKKEELINLILAVKSGNVQPSSSNKGRKPKVNPMLDMSIWGEEDKNDSPYLTGDYTLYSPAVEFDTKAVILEGQVRFLNNSAPIIRIIEPSDRILDIPVPPSFIAKNNLKKDDVVQVKLVQSTSSYGFNVEGVLTINGTDIHDYNRDMFYELPSNPNSNSYLELDYNKYKYILKNTKILKGNSHFYEYKNENISVSEFVYDFCKNIKEENCNYIILNGKNTKANAITPDQNNIKIFNLFVENSYNESSKDIILAQECVKNLITQGKKVVFIINELEEIFKILNYTTQYVVNEEVSPDTLTAIRRLINIAKFVSEEQNSTVIIFSSFAKSKYQNVLENDILRTISFCEYGK